MTSRALRRYYDILSGDAAPKYKEAKLRCGDADLRMHTDRLWQDHGKLMAAPLQGGPKNGYITLLDIKLELAKRILEHCILCERRCGVNRIRGESGHCGVIKPRISSEFIHMGEEPDLVPSYTIFFAGCTFDCVFCQNWDISTRPDAGQEIPPNQLASMIERRANVKESGLLPSAMYSETVRNVNWVGGDPTSNLHYIIEVLRECEASLPQVWNSNMYLTEESMRLLSGIIDVYLTDFKYGNDKCALMLSNAPRYMDVVPRNHKIGREHAEMIIRHLVLPGHLECCTRPILKWIADNLEDVKVNVMAQYRPEHRARDFPELARRITRKEFDKAVQIAEELGLDLTY